jgi:hypothetical protein
VRRAVEHPRRAAQRSSAALAGIIGARRECTALTISLDPLQVGRGRAEVGMPELALDDVGRHPLAREFDSMRMPQLMWRQTAANARLRSEFSQFAAHGGRWPRPPAGRAVDDAEQRTDGKLDAVLAPATEVLLMPMSA